MWRLIASLYSRRIVNVNVNILAAGVLALGPVLLIVKGYHLLGLDAKWLWVVTFVADVLCDVVIYYILHFLANHLGRPSRPVHAIADASVEHVPFFRDATKVQMQRAVLSPLLYGLWLGTQQYLIHQEGWRPVDATALGFCIGVGTARGLHTMWMIWEERRALLKALRLGPRTPAAAAGANPVGGAITGASPHDNGVARPPAGVGHEPRHAGGG
jgi:hypothetical protein